LPRRGATGVRTWSQAGPYGSRTDSGSTRVGRRSSARTLANEPRAVVHLESAEDVLIVEGLASLLDLAQVPADVVVAYTDKYGGEWDGGDPNSLWLWFTIDPRSAMSWSFSDLRNTAIRYDFE
jgi:hypothetical protein